MDLFNLTYNVNIICPGDTRSQGINSHSIDPSAPGIFQSKHKKG